MTVRYARTVALGLLVAAVAGCVGRFDGSVCDFDGIPVARGGDIYTYALDGNLLTTPLSGMALDAQWTGDRSARNGPFVSDGSAALQVHVSKKVSPVLTSEGDEAMAWTWSYTLVLPDGRRVEYFRELVDPASGTIIATEMRWLWQRDDGLISNEARLAKTNWLPFFGAPLLWAENAAEEGVRWSFLGDRATPGSVKENGTYELGPARHEETCSWSVAGHVRQGTAVAEITLAFDPSLALPAQVKVITGALAMELRLTSFEPGDGRALTAPTPVAAPQAVLASETRPNGVPGGDIEFPTRLEAALRQAHENPAVADFLARNPDSRLVELRHRIGSNQTPDVIVGPPYGIEDEWILFYTTVAGDGLKVTVMRVRDSLGVLTGSRYEVLTKPEVGPYPVATPLASLDELARLHAAYFGQPPEVLVCRLDWDLCGIGTHANTGRPRAGETGGESFAKFGLVVGMSERLVFQAGWYGLP